MRKTILALAMAAMSSGVWAEWVKVSSSDGGSSTYYVDPATIRKDGNLRRVWGIMDLKVRDKDGEMSHRALSEYDCKEERNRFLSFSTHSESMAGGKILLSVSTTGDWAYIAPDTVGAAILKYVCAR